MTRIPHYRQRMCLLLLLCCRAHVCARPQVWAEVYVGGSANGCWLHVDGLLGCYDQPGVVEAAVVRRQPLSYVVAAQEGAPKDVTRRSGGLARQAGQAGWAGRHACSRQAGTQAGRAWVM